MTVRLTASLRSHWLFFAAVPPLIIIMTFPIAWHVIDASQMWLPATNYDIWMKFWDAWYGERVFAGSADFYFTDLLFYPQGMSLVYHNFNVPHMLLFSGLQRILPLTAAYCLAHLLIILADICAAYLYLCYLLRDKLAALLGAAVFGLAPFVINQPHHPDIILVAVIPLTLYCLERGIDAGRWHWHALAGLIAGFTVFTGMYIFICLLMTVAIRLLILARHWLRSPAFWRGILLLFVMVGCIAMLRVYPMVLDRGSLDDALDKSRGRERFNDLLALFVYPGHSLTQTLFVELLDRPVPKVDAFGYLGYLPLLLMVLGMARAQTRRRMAPWLVMLLPFLLLRLGSFLTVDGQVIESVALPKHLLGKLLPVIFEAFWEVSNFHIGIQLPLAVLTALGLAALLAGMSSRWRLALVAVALIWLAYEYYLPPRWLNAPGAPPAFDAWLKQEEAQTPIKLVNLPINRRASKLYGYYQTFNGYPHVEGLASRTPPDAFAYIEGNSLLRTWRSGAGAYCLPVNRQPFLANLDRLRADGFSHVILHQWLPGAEELAHSFVNVAAAYDDGSARIYRLEDLRGQCKADAMLSLQPSAEQVDILTKSAVLPAQGAAILSLHGDGAAYETLARYQESALQTPRHWRLVTELDDDIAAALAHKSVILLAHDTAGYNPQTLANYHAWLESRYDNCGRIDVGGDATVVAYLRRGYGCDLLSAAEPMVVEYDKGIQLGNLLLARDGERLDLYLLWSRLPQTAHALSVQFLDESGARRHGQDAVIGLEPAAKLEIDLSPLPPGDYRVVMIVYDTETRASVPGMVVSQQRPFARELDIGNLTVE